MTPPRRHGRAWRDPRTGEIARQTTALPIAWALVPRLQCHDVMERMGGVYNEIQRFIASHQGCGGVKGRVQPPTADGYAVSVSCDCGEQLSRWVTPEAARYDLIFSTLLCSVN
jgi:hypothetical protein